MQQKHEEYMASLPFGTVHPSALRQGLLPHWVPAVATARGALRYRCPVAGSFVLLTDSEALEALSAETATHRCSACGDVHVLERTEVAGVAAVKPLA
jgi:hypothetical protein